MFYSYVDMVPAERTKDFVSVKKAEIRKEIAELYHKAEINDYEEFTSSFVYEVDELLNKFITLTKKARYYSPCKIKVLRGILIAEGINPPKKPVMRKPVYTRSDFFAIVWQEFASQGISSDIIELGKLMQNYYYCHLSTVCIVEILKEYLQSIGEAGLAADLTGFYGAIRIVGT